MIISNKNILKVSYLRMYKLKLNVKYVNLMVFIWFLPYHCVVRRWKEQTILKGITPLLEVKQWEDWSNSIFQLFAAPSQYACEGADLSLLSLCFSIFRSFNPSLSHRSNETITHPHPTILPPRISISLISH